MIVKSFVNVTPANRYRNVTQFLKPGNPNWRERINTIDLLVYISCFSYWNYIFPFLQNKLSSWGGQLYWAFPFGKTFMLKLNKNWPKYRSNFQHFFYNWQSANTRAWTVKLFTLVITTVAIGLISISLMFMSQPGAKGSTLRV